MKYLRLIRLPNLFILALSQILIHYCLVMQVFIASSLGSGTFPKHLSEFQFYLLVASTILIAIAGYIINDYFDVQIDEVNRPGKNIIGKGLTPSTAKMLFYVLSSAGILIGFYLAIVIGKPIMGAVQLFTAGTLWMYSSQFKRRLLIGNFLVSFLCALSLLVVGLFEPEFYVNMGILLWYVIPAFLLTFVRELIKDIEDIDGDQLSQCRTAPIVLGLRKTKAIIILLLVLTMAYVAHVLFWNFYTNTVVSFWYLISFFMIPLLGLLYLVATAEVKRDYHYASLFTKVIMLFGILTLIPFWYYFIR